MLNCEMDIHIIIWVIHIITSVHSIRNSWQRRFFPHPITSSLNRCPRCQDGCIPDLSSLGALRPALDPIQSLSVILAASVCFSSIIIQMSGLTSCARVFHALAKSRIYLSRKKEWIHPMNMWPQNMQIEPTMARRMVGFWCLAISSRFSPEIHSWSMICRFLAPSYFGML